MRTFALPINFTFMYRTYRCEDADDADARDADAHDADAHDADAHVACANKKRALFGPSAGHIYSPVPWGAFLLHDDLILVGLDIAPHIFPEPKPPVKFYISF